MRDPSDPDGDDPGEPPPRWRGNAHRFLECRNVLYRRHPVRGGDNGHLQFFLDLGPRAERSVPSHDRLFRSPQTSGIFDPDAKGMPRGQTVYLTGEVLLSTGEKSGLSPAYSWTVPIVTTAPTLSSLSISGPSSVSESSSGTYAATAAWSDGIDDVGDPGVERFPDDVRLDRRRRRPDDAGGDVEPDGDGERELHRGRALRRRRRGR